MMDDRKPRSQPPTPEPRSLSSEDRQLPEGRLRQELARKKRCCANCVYATRPCGRWFRLVLAEFAGLLICANSAEAPGELRGVPGCGMCCNFRTKRPATVRTAPPPPPDDKAFYYIPLTQGQHALVDAEDYEWLRAYQWHAVRLKGRFYAYRSQNGRRIAMHRQIMPPPPGLVVDHIDGNALNNRRCNLRVCTPRQNAWNHQRKRRPGGGYQRQGQPDKWYVRVECDGEETNLGPFDSEIEAARARDRKAIELFGQYARLNFPREDYAGEQKAEDGGSST